MVQFQAVLCFFRFLCPGFIAAHLVMSMNTKVFNDQLATRIIREIVILIPLAVTEMVELDINMTDREKNSLHSFVSRQVPKTAQGVPKAFDPLRITSS